MHRSYLGADGRRNRVEPDVVRAVLGAMGVAAQTPTEAARSLTEARRLAIPVPLDPVIVHRLGAARTSPVTLPASVNPHDAWVSLELEDGDGWRERLSVLSTRPGIEREVDGRRLAVYEVTVGAGHRLPAGYHRITVEAPEVSGEALVIAAPTCPLPERGWGIFVPLHALRSEGDWGIGSYPDLGSLGAWVRAAGGSFVGTLPLYPLLLEHPIDPSPYLPASRLAYNELYVDPAALPELALAPEARRVLESGDFTRRLVAARRARLVDYDAVASLRREVLEPMAHALFAGASSRRDELERFATEHPELGAYARFRAARDAGVGWSRDAPTAPSGPEREAYQYHLYAQWAAAQQLAASGSRGGLYVDLPVGVHPEGFDPRWEPESFVAGAQGGAPPDDFQPNGQNWGFPPLHPQGIRSSRYRLLIATLRRAFAHATCLRVDHVMGLRRLYWVPAGFDAHHGTYVGYHHEELRALVALEAHRAGAAVVGEDLGTVPVAVRRAMTADRMLRSWVLQFESSVQDPLPSPPLRALASWGTHDLPHFGAFFSGDDIEERERSGSLSPEGALAARDQRRRWRESLSAALGLDEQAAGDEVVGAAYASCLAWLARSEADLVVVDLEDTWGERQPQNRPGTGPEADNWRRRARFTLSELSSHPEVLAVLEEVDRARRARWPGSDRPGH